MHAEHANAVLAERGTQLLVPAKVLILHELMGFAGKLVALLEQREAIGPGLAVAILDLLHQPRDSHFEKFVQVAGADGQKLQAFEQRNAFVLRFFQDTAVEGQPGNLAVDVVVRVVERKAGHN